MKDMAARNLGAGLGIHVLLEAVSMEAQDIMTKIEKDGFWYLWQIQMTDIRHQLKKMDRLLKQISKLLPDEGPTGMQGMN